MQDFEQQRREAEERVREMNRNYRRKAGITETVNQKETKQGLELNTNKNQNNIPTRRPFDILKMLRLDGLKGDPDRLLLLGIFLLLNGEEVDELLLYALLYIML